MPNEETVSGIYSLRITSGGNLVAHISTGPDNTNNILALAFGILIVILVVGGSLWIMDHLNHNMLPMEQLMKMQA